MLPEAWQKKYYFFLRRKKIKKFLRRKKIKKME